MTFKRFAWEAPQTPLPKARLGGYLIGFLRS